MLISIFCFIIVYTAVTVCVHGVLRYPDDIKVFDIMDLNNLDANTSIVIEKDKEIKYHVSMVDQLTRCSSIKEYTCIAPSDAGGKTNV